MQRKLLLLLAAAFALFGLTLAGWPMTVLPLFRLDTQLVFGTEDLNWFRLLGLVRMFGISLVCLAAAIYALGLHSDQRRGLGLVGGAFLLAALLSLAQQIALWETPVGAVLAVAFASVGISYVWTAAAPLRTEE